MAVKVIVNNIRLPRISGSNCIFTLLKLDCSLLLACYDKSGNLHSGTPVEVTVNIHVAPDAH